MVSWHYTIFDKIDDPQKDRPVAEGGAGAWYAVVGFIAGDAQALGVMLDGLRINGRDTVQKVDFGNWWTLTIIKTIGDYTPQQNQILLDLYKHWHSAIAHWNLNAEFTLEHWNDWGAMPILLGEPRLHKIQFQAPNGLIQVAHWKTLDKLASLGLVEYTPAYGHTDKLNKRYYVGLTPKGVNYVTKTLFD